jgi:hypothetical protein
MVGKYAWFIVLAFALAPAAARAVVQAGQPSPAHHLVYSFTWGATTNLEMHTSGFAEDAINAPTSGQPSGITDTTGGTDDRGTITVDVRGQQPDQGLVVDVSEQAQGRRSAPAATCVVFGNTTVICEAGKRINAEELTLLRFLGSNFLDATQLDSKQHWQVVNNGGDFSTTSDYTITHNDNGAMTIDEIREVKDSGARPLTTMINSTIGYDSTRKIPVTISELSVERRESSEQYQTVKAQTFLRLESDSPPSTH